VGISVTEQAGMPQKLYKAVFEFFSEAVGVKNGTLKGFCDSPLDRLKVSACLPQAGCKVSSTHLPAPNDFLSEVI
jgi:hypothetical protein